MRKDSAKRKVSVSSIIGLLVGIGFITVGIYNIVTSRIDAKEYRNTTDIRMVSALVEECHRMEKKDENDDRIKHVIGYDLKLSFEVDGKTYTTKGRVEPDNSAFRDDIYRGDTINIEVYRTSKGEYKVIPSNDPVDFLLACLMIPLGSVFFLALVYDLQKRTKGENSMESGCKTR